MDIWISIAGLAVAILSWTVASAVRHGKLQQRVIVLERDITSHSVWRDTTGQQISGVGKLHDDMANVANQLRGINSALGDLRVVIGRMEGYQEAQRERDRIQRRETLQP